MSKRTAKYNIPNPTQQNPFALSYGLVSKGVFALALPTTKLYRDSAGTVREAVDTESAGPNAPVAMVSADMDTNGNPVPTYKEHTYTYYGAGQVHSDTVTDGVNTWVKTFMYENGQQVRDSGWVKQ